MKRNSKTLKFYKVDDYAGDSYYLCIKCENIYVEKIELIQHLKQKCKGEHNDKWFEDWVDQLLFIMLDITNIYKNEQIDELKNSIDNETRELIKHLVRNTTDMSRNNKNRIKDILRPLIYLHKFSIIKHNRSRETCYEVT